MTPHVRSKPGGQKRNTTRLVQAVPITVASADTLGQPFVEKTSTIIVNCHGCKYSSKHYVPKHSDVTLEIPHSVSGLPPRSMRARVVWVERPTTVREKFRIGVKFYVPGNVWGVAFPPEDWFPYPEDVASAKATTLAGRSDEPSETTNPVEDYGIVEQVSSYRTKVKTLGASLSPSRVTARGSDTGSKYEVALSFAGEDRQYVEKTADELKRRHVSCFYDGYELAAIWGKDLYAHLDEIYRHRSKYTVMFISKHYAQKLWTNHERKSAQARAFAESREYILPARFDDTEVPGLLPTVGFVDLRKLTPSELADLIVKKLRSH
jgi:hypothetical protein